MLRSRWHISVLVLTLALLIGGLLSYTFVKNGYFPIAKIGVKFVSYKTVKENMDVSKRIYSNGLAGSSEEMELLFKRGNENLLFRNALENLITNEIIMSSAPEDLILKAKEEIENDFGGKSVASIADFARQVYGWDGSKFTKRILEPQAILDILTKEKGGDFDSWLESSKKKAKVKVWFVPFEWKDGRLENRK